MIRRVLSYIDLGRGMCIFHLLVKNLGTNVYVVRFEITLPSMPNTEILFSSNKENLMNYIAVLGGSIRYL